MAAPNKAEQAIIEARRAKLLRLYIQGNRPRAIAAILTQEYPGDLRGYNSSTSVSADLKRVLDRNKADRAKEQASYTDMMLEQYAAMRVEAWRVLEMAHYVVNQGVVVYLRGDGLPEENKGQGWRPRKVESLERETALIETEIRERAARGDEPLKDGMPILKALDVLIKIANAEQDLLGLKAPIKKQVEVQASGDLGDQFAAALGLIAGVGPAGAAEDDPDGGEPDSLPDTGGPGPEDL